jgi:hypothetical protein
MTFFAAKVTEGKIKPELMQSEQYIFKLKADFF